MSLTLKRGVEVLVGALLMVAMLAVFPALAEAQENEGAATTQGEAQSAKRSAAAADAASADAASGASVVVSPGDSLWKISSERLGPEATRQEIAGEVERIYALNQDQIGGNPNLILPGQELSLPTLGRPSVSQPTTGARQTSPTERGAGRESARSESARSESARSESARSESARSESAKRESAETSQKPAVGTPTHKVGKTHEAAVRSSANLPGAPAAAPVPAVRSVSSKDSPAASEASELATFFSGPRLGLGIIALTLLVGALLAWKLPMRRSTRDGEAWGIHSGYRAFLAYPYSSNSNGHREVWVPSASYSTNNGTNRLDLGRIAQAKRRTILNRRVPRLGLSPRKDLASGAHAPEVRQARRQGGG